MDFSRLAGWIAILLLAISFCSAIKSPRLNKIFRGYRKQLKFHHLLGVTAVLFMIGHLIALLLDYASSISQLFDPFDVSIWTGWIALMSTVILVLIAFRFRSSPYRRWRHIHLLLIPSFLTAVIHSYIILEPRTILEWFMIVSVTLIGMLGIAWTMWISQRTSFGTSYTIVKHTELRPDLFLQTLQAKSTDAAIEIEAGQYVYLSYSASQFSRMWHPFTVIGFSDSGELELLIKARGRDTNLLPNILLPSPVSIHGPFGSKFWQTNESQLWLAYGVGIAIFIAAARTVPENYNSKIHLTYCEKSFDRIILRNEFDLLVKKNCQFSWEQSYGEGKEVLRDLEKRVEHWSKEYKLIRICGHPGFQDSAKKLFRSAGVPSHSIILEGLY
ncbi:MAG: ferric reductase-like transmembrane domain-containing protein [Oligoflexales bacterium]|nr:ferric reductase-like transmembrane domain-containing protein [Oligoflexales bacterium]